MARLVCHCSIVYLIVLGAVALHGESQKLQDEAILWKTYQQWLSMNGRQIINSVETVERFQVFKTNVEKIERFNRAGNSSYKLTANEMADMTDEEFVNTRLGYKPPPNGSKSEKLGLSSFEYKSNEQALPESIDWRQKGAVTGVKQQGACGSCWAFGVVAAVEGLTKLKTGKLLTLSEQQLVDCTTADEVKACDGGWPDQAFEYLSKTGGISLEQDYPYKDGAAQCMNTTKKAVAKISGYKNVPVNEKELLKAVAQQPVTVVLNGNDIRFYSSGVFSGPCTNDLTHVVTIVGYGVSVNGMKYWLVKNSWGENWGEGGYLRIQRDAGNQEGMCGIAMAANYPVA